MWWMAVAFQAFIAPVLTGALLLVALAIPGLEGSFDRWALGAAVVGFVLAAPLSFLAAKSAPRQI